MFICRSLKLLSSRIVLALAAGLAAATVQAQAVPLSDQDLSAVNGQGLLGPGPGVALALDLNNTTFGGLDFTRVTVKADINLNANFRNITLGEYNLGADIDIPLLQFGRSDILSGETEARRLVQLTDPYLEVVYRGAADAVDREIIGLRLGFGGVAGDIGLQGLVLSGSVLVDGGAAGAFDINGRRQVSGGLTLASLGGIRAGDATGPSNDLWLAVLKTDVQFPTPASGLAPDLAQAGFWLNWRDKLTALNVNLPPPPNLPPAVAP